MTFQSLVLTNGIQTMFMSLYQPTKVPWRPVFDVPDDFNIHRAFNGVFIKTKSGDEYKWSHPTSGLWSEEVEKGPGEQSQSVDGDDSTVYRLPNVKAV